MNVQRYIRMNPSHWPLAGRAVALTLVTLVTALSLVAAPASARARPALTLKAEIPTVTANNEWTPKFEDFDGVAMALVPPGCMMMGSDYGPSERPIHKICFDTPFWIDTFEVTNEQFKAFKGVAKRVSYWADAKQPREFISWYEAVDYCALRGGRLPTEAEWEYAAKGPDNLDYPWGMKFDPNGMVYAENSGLKAQAVGSKPKGASWVGAQDLIGNVWEYASTLYADYPYNANDGREDLTLKKYARVMRGGSYHNFAFTRTQLRGYVYPDSVGNDVGLRCAMDYTP